MKKWLGLILLIACTSATAGGYVSIQRAGNFDQAQCVVSIANGNTAPATLSLFDYECRNVQEDIELILKQPRTGDRVVRVMLMLTNGEITFEEGSKKEWVLNLRSKETEARVALALPRNTYRKIQENIGAVLRDNDSAVAVTHF